MAQHAARICEAHIVDIAIADNRVFRIAASFGKLGRLSSGETAPLIESFAALNAHLLECCRRRMADCLRGHDWTIGARLERDLAALQTVHCSIGLPITSISCK